MRNLIELKERYNAQILLTTEKDWMRMAASDCEHSDIAYLSIRFALTSNKDQIFDMIKDGVAAIDKVKDI